MSDKKKNRVTLLIEECRFCPNATVKFNKKEMVNYMYCQTQTSCILLGRCSGARPIPDWCPRLNRKKNLCGKRAEIPGIIS